MIVLALVSLVLCLYKMTIWSLLSDHLVKVYGRNFLFGCIFFLKKNLFPSLTVSKNA